MKTWWPSFSGFRMSKKKQDGTPGIGQQKGEKQGEIWSDPKTDEAKQVRPPGNVCLGGGGGEQ